VIDWNTEIESYNETSQIWNVDDPLVTTGVLSPATTYMNDIVRLNDSMM